MTSDNESKQLNKDQRQEVDADQGQREGRPNPGDPSKQRSEEHQGSYGGKGGEPRTPSNEREPKKS